jgi:hypothetical protein
MPMIKTFLIFESPPVADGQDRAAALRSIYDPSLALRNVDPWHVIAQPVEHGNSWLHQRMAIGAIAEPETPLIFSG